MTAEATAESSDVKGPRGPLRLADGTEPGRYGLPSNSNINLRLCYVSSLDHRMKVPVWVAEHLTVESTSGTAHRKEARFREDADVPPLFRSQLGDYQRSGYSRGHMAPAGNHVGVGGRFPALGGGGSSTTRCPRFRAWLLLLAYRVPLTLCFRRRNSLRIT